MAGIFGVAYPQGNKAEHFTQVTPLKKWNMTQVEANGSAPRCPKENFKPLPYSNWQQWLSEDGMDKQRFGIYWSGKLGQAEGSMYYGDAAIVGNPHYDPRTAQKAKMSNVQGEGSYSVDIRSFTLRTGNASFTWNIKKFGPTKNEF